VGGLRGLLEHFARTDHLIGPRHLLTAVQDQAAFVKQLCQVATEPNRRDLLEVAARFAEFSGWLHQDAGDFKTAMFWTDRAMDYVQELGDPRMISYVLMRKSNIATDARQPGLGLGLADAALRPNGELTPRLRAVALRQRANAYAITGDANACARALDNAMSEITELRSQQPASDVATYCTPAYVEMEAANCWLQLRQPAKAIPIFEQGIADWPDGQERDRGLCLARLATAHAFAGDIEAASSVGQQALTILRTAHSAHARPDEAAARAAGTVA
jgi:tetratricopeptide (TPR) repeat protein